MIQHHSQTETAHAHPKRLRPSRGRRLAGSLVAGVMMALILAGCTTPPAAPPTSTAGTSTTPAVESTAPPPPTTDAPVYKPATDQGPAENVPVPVLPEKAKEFSKEGLIAFAEYWYSTLGYAFETGDPKPMMEISKAECTPCQSVEKSAIGGHADGKWIVGGQMRIVGTDTAFEPVADGTYQVIATVRQENVKYFKADGTLSKDLGITTAIEDIVVASYNGTDWAAQTVEHLQGSKGM